MIETGSREALSPRRAKSCEALGLQSVWSARFPPSPPFVTVLHPFRGDAASPPCSASSPVSPVATMMAHVGRALAGVASRRAPLAAAARSLASPMSSSPLAAAARPQARGAATITCREALNSAIDEEMEREDSTLLYWLHGCGGWSTRAGGGVSFGWADGSHCCACEPWLGAPGSRLFVLTALVSDWPICGAWSLLFSLSAVVGMQRCS